MPALCCASLLLLLCAGCSNGSGSVGEPAQQAGAQEGFSIGGTVSGLTGSGLVLQNNGAGNLSISGNGAFTFAGLLGNGAAYNVSVLSQPSGPAQICTVTNGSGAIPGGHVTSIVVSCASTAFAVGGTVTGLAGSGLILRSNGADDMAIVANGTFTFPQLIATGSSYDVSVGTQPTNPSQLCTVTNGSGTMGAAPVTSISIQCETGQFAVGGTVSGLLGHGLVLQNNGTDDLAIGGNGQFAFVTRMPGGTPYSVVVTTQPSGPAQNCVVRNSAGTVNNRNVTDVAVSCRTGVFTIGGSVDGLAGAGLVLQLNGGDNLSISRSGKFAFGVGLADGTAYSASIQRQPGSPSQTCTLANATGVVAGSNVGNIAVTCVTNSFSVGGVVSGLAGAGLALQLNGGGDLSIASNGSFTFATRVASGAQYRVSIRTQPSNPAQTCTLVNASGTVGNGEVTNVRIACATSSFSVGGAVNGLMGVGLVLQNNGDDALSIHSNGPFTFAQSLASGARYDVTVRTEPSDPAQACTVANGSGVIGTAHVANVSVSCTTSEFTIGGTVRGLIGSGLVLRNNGGDDRTIERDGAFTFPTALPTGARYSVTVAAQPVNPGQTCTVENASGVVSGRVTNIEIACVANGFTIGGQVSGLDGAGLVLQNNGGDDLAIASNGGFTFATELRAGASYHVTIEAQPANQTCTVENASGVVSERVTNIRVECASTAPRFHIRVRVRDLEGVGLVLQNNGGDNLAIPSDGEFVFATPLPSGATFEVTVAQQPVDPAQRCEVRHGDGVVHDHDVDRPEVRCDEPDEHD